VDLVISNCVVNLSPDKRAVMREVHRVLADGGEFYFSDVYCDRRLPAAARADPLLVGECLGVRACCEAAGARMRVLHMCQALLRVAERRMLLLAAGRAFCEASAMRRRVVSGDSARPSALARENAAMATSGAPARLHAAANRPDVRAPRPVSQPAAQRCLWKLVAREGEAPRQRPRLHSAAVTRHARALAAPLDRGCRQLDLLRRAGARQQRVQRSLACGSCGVGA
jgi:hypothetical protein